MKDQFLIHPQRVKKQMPIATKSIALLAMLGWFMLEVVVAAGHDDQLATSDSLALIPRPTEIVAGKGRFTVTAQTRILVDKATSETGHYLAELIEPATGYSPTVEAGSASDSRGSVIVLALTPENTQFGDEGYELTVTTGRVVIRAPKPAGVFYGVQTLRQLLPPQIESKERSTDPVEWSVPCVRIRDKPQYRWRGLMLDPARQFLTPDFLKRYVDIMAFHKMNHLHLHLTDNQAWTVEIKKYPELTDMKRWPAEARKSKWKAGVYSQDDIRELVAHAAKRHVTIVPEIEMPAHFSVIGAALPQIMCPNNPRRNDVENWEALMSHQWVSPCPGSDQTFEILENILSEVIELFPSSYIHLGGDEWYAFGWKDCPRCKERLEKEELRKAEGGNDQQLLYRYLMRRVSQFVVSKGRKPMFWYDAAWGGSGFPKGSVVHMWHEHGRRPHLQAAKAGHEVLSSSVPVLYFDLGKPSAVQPVYQFDPMPATMAGTELADRLVGMSAPLWSQTEEQMDYRAFPRGFALAETSWTDKAKLDWSDFQQRLSLHRERIDIMGVNDAGPAAQPAGRQAQFGGVEVGQWQPQQMSPDEKRVTLKWDVSSEIKNAGGFQIVFDYENGQDGVYIESFVLLENGKEIARDDHRGWTGAADIDNVYKFRILALTTAAKYVVQARMYIPNGGTDSAGRVTLKRTGD